MLNTDLLLMPECGDDMVKRQNRDDGPGARNDG